MLEKVGREHQQYITKLQQNKQEYSLHYAKIWAQLALNLSDETEDKFFVTGKSEPVTVYDWSQTSRVWKLTSFS